MVRLCYEDNAPFTNFLRMPPDMYDELPHRVGPRITKTYTRYRDPLKPAGLKLALILHHLAHGNKYASMRFVWRVPHNTITVVCSFIRPPEVCEFNIPEQLVFLQELEHGLLLLIMQSSWSISVCSPQLEMRLSPGPQEAAVASMDTTEDALESLSDRWSLVSSLW